MSILKDGIPFIGIPVLIGIIFLAFGISPFVFIPGVTLIAIGLFCAYFFRDPKRTLNLGNNHFVSPADGTIMEITEEGGKKTVRIFLSVFNVHLQRSPCAGNVKSVEYVPGKFLPAMNKSAHMLNEQNIFTIETTKGDIVIKQIAGILARRVVSWVQPKEILTQGQKIGFIKFGSQVDIILPSTAQVTVRVGETVVGGETIIARYE